MARAANMAPPLTMMDSRFRGNNGNKYGHDIISDGAFI
jgi:hypothetical protein